MMTFKHSYIHLNQVTFFAHHGVSPQERVVGNEFWIDLKLKVDIRKASETDEVDNTVSYADVYTVLKEEMIIASNLLEHVCGRIIKRLFVCFTPIEEIEIKLTKRNPPMGAEIEGAGIEVHAIKVISLPPIKTCSE